MTDTNDDKHSLAHMCNADPGDLEHTKQGDTGVGRGTLHTRKLLNAATELNGTGVDAEELRDTFNTND